MKRPKTPSAAAMRPGYFTDLLKRLMPAFVSQIAASAQPDRSAIASKARIASIDRGVMHSTGTIPGLGKHTQPANAAKARVR